MVCVEPPVILSECSPSGLSLRSSTPRELRLEEVEDESKDILMKIKAILFDIDGTVIDTKEFVFGAFEYVLGKYSLKADAEKLNKAIGRPLVEFYQILFPYEDIEALAQAHRDFQDKNFHLGKAFPNAEKVLIKLKEMGIKLAAVSNRSSKGVTRSLTLDGLESYFDHIVTVDEVVNAKPHKDHPNKALELLGVSAEEALIIGDTENDILAGKNAGIKTVGVTYGWLGMDINKHNPDFTINNLSQLLKVLKSV